MSAAFLLERLLTLGAFLLTAVAAEPVYPPVYAADSSFTPSQHSRRALKQVAINQHGFLTYYEPAGVHGACTSTYVPPGHVTVAMNAPQFNGMCGACIIACTEEGGVRNCVRAIVDNKLPEGAYGDLDLGVWPATGRKPVDWGIVPCGPYDAWLKVTSQGSNVWYGKIKFERGPSAVTSVSCVMNKGPAGAQTLSPTPDGYWEIHDPTGHLGCGMKCTVSFMLGPPHVNKRVAGSLFGSCNP